MSTVTRDAQKQRLYDAEQQVRRMLDRADDYPMIQMHGSTVAIHPDRKFASVESIQSYVDTVLSLPWVRRDYLRAALPVTVRERAGWALAHYERWGSVIAIPLMREGKWACRELVVLHELAHHLCSTGQHGPEFARIFTELVDGVLGPEVGFVLRTTFHECGVRLG